jgi:N6-adenosine-specific RNA methylase IME4
MNLPDKKYSVIYADPPWSYRQHGTGPKSRGNAEQHYHTMDVDSICALPIRQLAGGGRAAPCLCGPRFQPSRTHSG